MITSRVPAIVVDASVLINIVENDQADAIVEQLGATIVVVDRVEREVLRGERSIVRHGQIKRWADRGIVDRHGIVAGGLQEFISLVSGELVQSLGDGEASVIAVGNHLRARVALDERKARSRWLRADRRGTRLVSSVELLMEAASSGGWSNGDLRNCILQSITRTRMAVPPEIRPQVRAVLGDTADAVPWLCP